MRFLILLSSLYFRLRLGRCVQRTTRAQQSLGELQGQAREKFKNAAEESERRKNWEANRDQIEKYNKEAAAGLHTYTLKENHMADWVDLRNHSCIAPVQNQGRCGSCRAFGATAAVEFRQCVKTGSLVKLSEQQLVDCDVTNSGCNAGNPTRAWGYLKTTAGQATSTAYPYTTVQTSVPGTCKYTSSMGATITGTYSYSTTANLTDVLRQLAYNGTVAAFIDVVSTFQSYGGGIYSETACNSVGTSVNHIVNLVGYGTQDGIPYWILCNSWAATWGSNGYALIKRGSNTCNIESYITYPVL